MSKSTLAGHVAHIFELLQQGDNVQVADGWARVFGVTRESFEFYQSLSLIKADLDNLCIDIDNSSLSGKSKSLAMVAVGSLMKYTQIHAMINLTTKHLEAEINSIDLIHMVDNVLPPLDRRDASDAEIISARELVSNLLSELDGLEIDHRLKAFLRIQIAQILWAIDSFDIIGMDGLTRTYGAASAEIMRALGMAGAGSAAAQSWFKKAGATMKSIANNIILAGGVATAVSAGAIAVFEVVDAIQDNHHIEAEAQLPATSLRNV